MAGWPWRFASGCTSSGSGGLSIRSGYTRKISFMRSNTTIGWPRPISLATIIRISGATIRRVFSSACGKVSDGSADLELLDERVNKLPTPFELEWHHLSWKPWDWKLVRVSNASFEIPADLY